jgi:hypothetical protein
MLLTAKSRSHSASGYKASLFTPILYSLLLLCFFFTFFLSIEIDTAPRTARTLYNDLDRRTHGNHLLLTILPIFVLPWLTFALGICRCTHFFHCRFCSNCSAKHLCSLAYSFCLLPLTLFAQLVSSPIILLVITLG